METSLYCCDAVECVSSSLFAGQRDWNHQKPSTSKLFSVDHAIGSVQNLVILEPSYVMGTGSGKKR